MEDSHNTSLVSSVEDFSPPPSPTPTELIGVSESADFSPPPPPSPTPTEELTDADASVSSEDEEDHYAAFGVLPYLFEPILLPAGSRVVAAAVQRRHPRDGMPPDRWCECGGCQLMPTGLENKCCREYVEVMNKCSRVEAELHCITEHPGFASVCLNPHVLQLEYATMMQYYDPLAIAPEYETLEDDSLETQYRYTAYRTFVRWCWGRLGERVRKVIPSCTVTAIRRAFPRPDSEDYVGFKWPDPIYEH